MSVIQRVLRKRLYQAGAETISDADLLRRFLHERDEAAFELLVHRHGAMVLGLCRKVIGDVHEAEDAFQATFLTLAQRAGTILHQPSLGSWLYKVSYRVALRCRSRVKTFTALETVPEQTAPPSQDSVESREYSTTLAEEVAQLSDRLRTVIILCCLQGKSSTEAARVLGCPVNTVSTRLFRAREQLRRNLNRRGMVFSGSISLTLGSEVLSAVSPAVAQSLSEIALRSLSCSSITSFVSPAVCSLMKGSVVSMWWKPMVVGIVLSSSLVLAAWPLWQVNAIEDAPSVSQAAPPIISIPGKPLDQLQNIVKSAPEEPVEIVAQFDLDGDGTTDLVETQTRGRGPLSTYYSSFQLKTGPGYRFLKWGVPLTEGESLTAADVMNGVEVISLCTDATSFQATLKKNEAHTGPWSGKKGALGLAKLKDNTLYLGYVTMTVSESGKITILETHWEPVVSNTVEVSLHPQDDVADVKSQELEAGKDPNKKYFLITPAKAAPAEGYGLILILPGGDGGAAFHPFVKRMFKNAIPDGYLVAQPVSTKWTATQQIVWPTEKNKVPGMKYNTEEMINAVIDDVSSRQKINASKVFTLGWSSGGPAVYAASLSCPKVAGSFVAMSVFNPKFLPALEKAQGHAYYLYHSPQDRTCPYRMAQQAVTDLGKAGAKVELKTYDGGHGWRGPLYDDIRTGIEWLEKNSRRPWR